MVKWSGQLKTVADDRTLVVGHRRMPRRPAGYAVDNHGVDDNLLGIRYSTMRFSRMVDVLVMSTYGGRVKDSDVLDFRLEPAEAEHGRKEVKSKNYPCL